MLKISIISGSNRNNSQSLRISKIYLQKLKAKKVGIDLINLAKEKLPFWEFQVYEGKTAWYYPPQLFSVKYGKPAPGERKSTF